jgi:phage N-6-adenine-methyltransferase
MNKVTQKVMFSSEKQDWETPQKLFDELNRLYGPFDLDVCASFVNTKCEIYYGQDRYGATCDGLVMNWRGTCWMNPPYSNVAEWIKKASEESSKGCRVVALVPARTNTKWLHLYCYNKPNVQVIFLKGRVKFVGAKSSAPFPSMVVVFG